jgi:hypothetical protein
VGGLAAGVIVTTHYGLRLRENIKIIPARELLSARLIGSDATTDLAVLGIDSDKLTPAPVRTISSPVPEKLCCRSGVPGWEISLRVAESSLRGVCRGVFHARESR